MCVWTTGFYLIYIYILYTVHPTHNYDKQKINKTIYGFFIHEKHSKSTENPSPLAPHPPSPAAQWPPLLQL